MRPIWWICIRAHSELKVNSVECHPENADDRKRRIEVPPHQLGL